MKGVLVAGLVVGVAVVGQGRPDFSGTWVEVRARLTNLLTGKPVEPQASGGSLPLPPGETVVTQTAETLTIERKVPKFDSSIRFVHRLDGSRSVNHNGAQTQTTTARWEGDRLVVEGTVFQATSAGETTWTIREVWYLQKGELVHELTWMQDGKPTTSSRRHYTRR